MTIIEADAPDVGHLLSDEEWAAVVVRADELYLQRVAAEDELGGAGDYDPMGLTPRYVSFPNSPNNKSTTLIRAQLYVIHTAECPLKVGYAASLSEWADGDSYNPRASWHRFVDPATVALFIPLNLGAWHAAGGNPRSIGYEQAGYASFTRAQWLVPDGLRQFDLLAQQIVKDNLPKSGIRWLSDAQVLAILQGKDSTTYGLCTHEQVSRLSGRTSRTDPGKGYPKDVLLDFVDWYHPATPRPGAVPPAPAPTPLPTTRWTRANVVTMQGYLELTKDGKWGPGTDAKAQAFRRVANANLPHSLSDIRATQKIVDVTVDGSFGPATKAALKKNILTLWQPLLKVSADGSWGPNTDKAFVAFHREWRGK